MEDRRVINDSYFCGRFRVDGPIAVLTTTQYVVAEYDERTGDIRWQRVVNASQRDGIHNWLREHFPARNAQKATEKAAPKRRIAAASSNA
jgi:hypothetical protein